jgi:hypothetical protein
LSGQTVSGQPLHFDQFVCSAPQTDGLSVLELVLPVDLFVDGAHLVSSGIRVVAEA